MSLTQFELFAIVALLVFASLSFLFSLAESALVACRTGRLEQAVDRSDEAAAPGDNRNLAAINELLREPTRIVAAVQIGNTVCNLAAAAIAVGVLAPYVSRVLMHVRVPHPVLLAVVILVALLAVLMLVVGEIIPRAVAQRQPERIALLVAQPLRWLELLERPVIAVVLGLSNLIVRPFGMTASFAAPVITEEELKTLLEASQEEGVIEQDEKEMLRNVITFGDTMVHEVMTPRIDIKAADVGTSITKMVNLIVDCGHSRIPIYETTVDNIIGIIHAKDLLPALATGRGGSELRPMMRRIGHVPENKRVDELLEEFRRSKSQIAIVQDEYGGTAGLVTVEDLLEEIVGEIQDEYDVEQPKIVLSDDGSAEVDARLHIDDVNEALDLDLSSDDFDTIGGFVFGLFGHMPLQDETIDYESVSFTITDADGRRVYRLKVAPRVETDTEQGDDGVESAAE
ncbi:MAG: hemolysin family protein [Capsulimonadaceae bacterium]|nr:hemolysin family protein [Capsulimonadaceae bacterium]